MSELKPETLLALVERMDKYSTMEGYGPSWRKMITDEWPRLSAAIRGMHKYLEDQHNFRHPYGEPDQGCESCDLIAHLDLAPTLQLPRSCASGDES